jgi:cell division septation protein DedD
MHAQPEPQTVAPPPVVAEEPSQPEEKVVEFEIVLGRTQVAGVLFVAIVAVVVFSAISYVAGRALVAKPVVSAAPVEVAPAPTPAPVVEATIVKPDFPIAEPAPKAPEPTRVPEAPVFATPSANGVYLQMGAVEKGVAVIMVEGLRKRGFSAFAAPGPTDVIFRVLIGPLGDAEGFRKTKEKIDQIGLNSFVRKYQP